KVTQDLKQMVLNHVTDRASLVVERTSALHAEVLSHRDLHALDVVAVPNRFQERVREAKEHYVFYLSLPKVVIDPKDRALIKDAQQHFVQLLRRREVVAEGLFNNYSCALRAARLYQLFHYRGEQYRRNRQVMRRAPGILEFLAQCLKRGRVLVVA